MLAYLNEAAGDDVTKLYLSYLSLGMGRDVVNVFLAIEFGCICNVGTGVVRNDCDVIANFLLIRITDEWVKWVADRDIRGPVISAVGAVGIKELRSDVVRRVTHIVPDCIDSTARRDGEGTEPVPFRMIY